MSDFKIEKVGEVAGRLKTGFKKHYLLIFGAGAVVVAGFALYARSKNSSTDSTTSGVVIDPLEKIATNNGTNGTTTADINSQITQAQAQTYSDFNKAITESQQTTLNAVANLLDQQKVTTDQKIGQLDLSFGAYENQNADTLKKITDSVANNASEISNKFATLDQKISSIPIYTPAPAVNYNPVATPVYVSSPAVSAPVVATPAVATPVVSAPVVATPTQAPATAKEKAVSVYQNGTNIGNNGVGYNKAVSDSFEASLKTNQSAYQAEMARVDQVIANRVAQGLDITNQVAYKNKIQQ